MSIVRGGFRCPRILMVEDNRGDAMLTRLAFKRSGRHVEIDVVETAETGLRYLEHAGEDDGGRAPDLILVDLNLPHMPGHQFVRHIKENPALRHLPIVVLSSSSDSHDIRACYDCHANGYVTKPDSMDGYLKMACLLDDYWFGLVQSASADEPPIPPRGMHGFEPEPVPQVRHS